MQWLNVTHRRQTILLWLKQDRQQQVENLRAFNQTMPGICGLAVP